MIDFGFEDLVDIQRYGSPSAISRPPGKNGERKNSFRNPRRKATARRYYKRISRNEGKNVCHNESQDY